MPRKLELNVLNAAAVYLIHCLLVLHFVSPGRLAGWHGGTVARFSAFHSVGMAAHETGGSEGMGGQTPPACSRKHTLPSFFLFSLALPEREKRDGMKVLALFQNDEIEGWRQKAETPEF